MILQLSSKQATGRITGSKDHECFCGHAAIGKLHSEDRAFANRRMFGKAEFDLERVDPLTAHFDQVVDSANERKESIDVFNKSVTGPDPTAVAHSLFGFVGPIPIARRVGVAANPH